MFLAWPPLLVCGCLGAYLTALCWFVGAWVPTWPACAGLWVPGCLPDHPLMVCGCLAALCWFVGAYVHTPSSGRLCGVAAGCPPGGK